MAAPSMAPVPPTRPDLDPAVFRMHGMLAGTDSSALQPMYVITGGLVIGSAAYRHWVVRRARALQPARLGPESRADGPAARPTMPLNEPIPVEVTIR